MPADFEEMEYPREASAHIEEVDLVAELVLPKRSEPGLMIDVGAHHGSSFRPFLRAGWKVLAFEPDDRHIRYLEEHYGDDARVVLDRRAVTDLSGQRKKFYTSEQSTGISGLSAFHESHVVSGEVETVALRDILDTEHVDLLKIDTEGFELPVLRGFPWDRVQPDVVIAEFEDRKTELLGYSFGDLVDEIISHGYEVWVSEWHPVIRYGIKHDWRRLVRYPMEPADAQAWGNLVAFKTPVDAARMADALSVVISAESGMSAEAGRTEPAKQSGPPQDQRPDVAQALPDVAQDVGSPKGVRSGLRAVARRFHIPIGPIKKVMRSRAGVPLLLSPILAVAGATAGAVGADEGAVVLIAGSVVSLSVAVLVAATKLARR